MMQKNITIGIPEEQQAMAVAVTVQKANKFESRIYIECRGTKVNAKSIVGMMSLGAANGNDIIIYTDGADEVQAALELEKYLSGKSEE
jgi:phosphotransferase system HPr (HPr) family protein